MIRFLFNKYIYAMDFLRKMEAGVVSRDEAGDGFSWVADESALSSEQMEIIRDITGDKYIWNDSSTGLTWMLRPRESNYIAYFINGREVLGGSNYGGHCDWRVPTLVELKTLAANAKDESGMYVSLALTGKVQGMYSSASNGLARVSCDDYMIWDFSTNSAKHQRYRDGKIEWGAEGEFTGFEKSGYSYSDNDILVRGYRTVRLSDWAATLIEWAEENNIYDFPATEENMLSLERLRIPVSVSQLPPEFSNLRGLKYLSFPGCSEIPVFLFEFKCLKELRLGDYGIAGRNIEVIPDLFDGLSSLVKLEILKLGVRELPESIFGLVNLKSLNLGWNNIEVMPSSVGKLINLEELDVRGNAFVSLPEEISQLRGLRSLCVLRSNVVRLPDGVCDLVNLEELDVGDTAFCVFPDGFLKLVNLNKLRVRNTKVSRLPDGFENLTRLRFIDISGTAVSELPESVGGLKELFHLNISGTLIGEIPDGLNYLENLKVFVFSNMPNLKSVSRDLVKRTSQYAL